MKNSFPLRQRGSAFVTIMIFSVILLALVGSILKYATFERRLNNRAKLLLESRMAAEAISEYGIAQVKNLLETNRTFTDNTWSTTDQSLFVTGGSYAGQIASPPVAFWAGGNIVTTGTTEQPLMHVGKILDVAGGGLHFVDPTNSDNDTDPLKGKRVFRYDLDILSRATAIDSFSGANLTKYMKQTFSIRAVPLFSNAVYYNMDLEVWPAPLMTITGATHTNQRLFAHPCGGNALNFAGPVTAVKGFWTRALSDSPFFHYTSKDGSYPLVNSGSVNLMVAGVSTYKPMLIAAATAGYTPNLSASTWVESTWGLFPTGETSNQHLGVASPNTETAATKLNFANWTQQTFRGNLLTNVNGLTAINLQGIPDYSYVYGSVYPDPIAGAADAAYTYVSGGNDLTNSAHGLVESPRLTTSTSYLKAVEDIKYSRNCGLYIVANTTGAAATGHQPDGTTITVGPRSYRAFLNDTTTNPYGTPVEVVLPGQDTFGNSNATANAFATHKNARPIIQLVNIDFATNQERGFAASNQRRMIDLRRVAGGASPDTTDTTFSHSTARSASNVYVPMNLYMIDIDMTELKKAVQSINLAMGTIALTTDSSFYLTGNPPTDATNFGKFIYNIAAAPTNVTLSDDTQIITTNMVIPTKAFTSSIWNGAVYVESIAADSFDVSAGTTAADIARRKSRTHEMRNSGVRLINGRGKVASINSTQGFTLATNDVVYIFGSFNADGLSSTPATVAVTTPPSVGASTGHNYETNELPASIAADAIYLLSQPSCTLSGTVVAQTKGWNDAYSGVRYSSSSYNAAWATSAPSSTNQHDGTNTAVVPYQVPYDAASGTWAATSQATKLTPEFSEYSVALLCGLVPTGKNGVTQNSGGLHNFPRFLEDWGGVDCRIRGSMVALFECRVGTDPWSLRTYMPPNRIWGFNLLFDAGIMPPLTPKTINFRRSGANDITKADYNVKLAAWGYTALP